MNIVAIIPARGGSKGIPKKNIKLLAGKPLIAYSIDQARRSKLIDRVVVSTDNREIAEISKKCGAEVLMRPKKLALDNSPGLPVLKHAINKIEETGYNVDYVVLLQPTSPLRTVEHIDKSINKILKTDSDSVTTISEIGINPHSIVKLEGDKTNFFIEEEKRGKVRQECEKLYNINSAVVVIAKEFLMVSNDFDMGVSENNNKAIVTNPDESIDIDTLFEMKLSEIILKDKIDNKKQNIRIGNKTIGNGESCFIIAEAGSNHNGDIKLAKKLVDVAVEAGVDAVKFQTFKAEGLVSKKLCKSKVSNFEMLKKLELDETNFKELKKYCDNKNIIFMSTPHSGEESVDLLEEIKVPAYKIGSGDLTNLPFLECTAKKKKPLIIGTGMGNMGEIKEAVHAIKNKGNNQIILLHCTTQYPCKMENVNLKVISKIKEETNCIVGYSDHTIGLETPIAAVAMGAKVIEKHFTLDKNMEGPDHKASLEPNELKKMVEKIRLTEKLLGIDIKKPIKHEEKIAKIARKSIIAKEDIEKGFLIKRNMLEIKRPGTGINPKGIGLVVGSIAKKDIGKDEIIKLKDISKIIIKTLNRKNMGKWIKTLVRLDKEFENLGEPIWERNNFLMNLPGKWVWSFVLFVENKIAGYIICSLKDKIIHIHRILVSKKFRNSGLGKVIITDLINKGKLNKNKAISLKVNKRNKKAIEFYKKNDFEVVSKAERHYDMKRYLK